jgi:hypothetical protein
VQTLLFFCWSIEPKYSTVLFLHKILVCDLKCGGCTRLTRVSCWESALYPHRIINIDLYSWCCVSSWIIKFIRTLNVQLLSSLWRQGWLEGSSSGQSGSTTLPLPWCMFSCKNVRTWCLQPVIITFEHIITVEWRTGVRMKLLRNSCKHLLWVHCWSDVAMLTYWHVMFVAGE